MEVKEINSGTTTAPKQNEKHQATIQRVQAEFINQLYQGKSEGEAFKNSLKAIDEKYNPKEDEYKTNPQQTVGCSIEGCVEKLGGTNYMMKSIKLPSGKTVIGWLKFIAEALPILLEIIDKIPKPEKTPTEELNQVA